MSRIQLFLIPLTLAVRVSVEGATAHTPAGTPPAQVTSPVEETQLTTVTLTPKAEQRLGIVTVAVERKATTPRRRFGGQVVLPLTAGPTETGQPASTFIPNPPASPAEVLQLSELQALADGAIQKAKVQLEADEIRRARAEQLVRAESGSQRDLDDAQAAVQSARTLDEIAKRRRALLGAPVEEMTRLDDVWVRVPVYVGDLSLLDQTAEAQVGGLGDRAGAPTRPARVAAGPPSSDPNAATVDWYYRVNNQDKALRLGQRVGIEIPLRSDGESLVIPWAAVLHDVQGGQWVYERVAPLTYQRQRVEVARVVDQEAILTRGPDPGAEVVTDGAVELFGTEFGAGH